MKTDRLPCSRCESLTLEATLGANDGLCARCARLTRGVYGLPPEIAAGLVPAPRGEQAALIQASRLARLNPALRSLLEAELSLGNSVVETAEDWPQPGSIFVMVGRPFLARESLAPVGVLHRELHDPHYWKEEYVHEASAHVLACRYGPIS